MERYQLLKAASARLIGASSNCGATARLTESNKMSKAMSALKGRSPNKARFCNGPKRMRATRI